MIIAWEDDKNYDGGVRGDDDDGRGGGGGGGDRT